MFEALIDTVVVQKVSSIQKWLVLQVGSESVPSDSRAVDAMAMLLAMAYWTGRLSSPEAEPRVIEWMRKGRADRDASGNPDYAKALGLFTLVIFVVLIFLAAIGPEKRGKEF